MRSHLFVGIASALAVVAVSCGESRSTTEAETVPQEAASPSATAAADELPYFASSWPKTDFTRHTVPYTGIIQGCGGRDCIPALDADGATSIPAARGGRATFVAVTEVNYASTLPVAYVSIGGEIRGYPLHVLTWHEIVNDRLGGVPIAVTFCPLCNTALGFDRRVGAETLDFGVSGNLRNSDLIMWDRQTESWWQQATGEGIVGRYAGTELTPVPVAVISFGDFARAYPSATILTEDTGFERDYGRNPYNGYDRPGSSPFLYSGKIDSRLDGLERVVALSLRGDALAVPFSTLAKAGVANVSVAGERLAVFWAQGTASALDGDDIASSRDVGAAVAYVPEARGESLTFRLAGRGTFRDEETSSSWDITGLAVSGPLAGERLDTAVHTVEFWFAFAAFHPAVRIWEP